MGGVTRNSPMLSLIELVAALENPARPSTTPRVSGEDYLTVCSEVYGQYVSVGITSPVKAQCERQMIAMFPLLTALLYRLLNENASASATVDPDQGTLL